MRRQSSSLTNLAYCPTSLPSSVIRNASQPPTLNDLEMYDLRLATSLRSLMLMEDVSLLFMDFSDAVGDGDPLSQEPVTNLNREVGICIPEMGRPATLFTRVWLTWRCCEQMYSEMHHAVFFEVFYY